MIIVVYNVHHTHRMQYEIKLKNSS